MIYAPITRLLDWLTTSAQYRAIFRTRQSILGSETLKAMREEIGNGEVGGNNCGPHIRRWGGKQGASWCAVVIDYAVGKACQRLNRQKPFGKSTGARQLFRRCVSSGGMLVQLEDIEPGDLVLFDRGDPARPGDDWKAHIGIVSRVERDVHEDVASWHYFAGNEGPPLAVVKEHEGTHRARRIGFARLAANA